jgi:8-oxo-dGTP diphosphatase
MRKHITVSAAVIIQNQTVFCAQRKDSGELARKWEFPGGKIEIGEIPEDALVREIKEELDSTISIVKKLTTVEHQYTTFDITMHAFLCQLVEGSLTLSEHLDSCWLPKDQLYSVDWAEADIPIVEIVKRSL